MGQHEIQLFCSSFGPFVPWSFGLCLSLEPTNPNRRKAGCTWNKRRRRGRTFYPRLRARRAENQQNQLDGLAATPPDGRRGALPAGALAGGQSRSGLGRARGETRGACAFGPGRQAGRGAKKAPSDPPEKQDAKGAIGRVEAPSRRNQGAPRSSARRLNSPIARATVTFRTAANFHVLREITSEFPSRARCYASSSSGSPTRRVPAFVS